MKPLSDYRRIKRAQERARLRKFEFKRSQEFLKAAALRLQASLIPVKVGHAWYEKGDE